MQRIKLVTNHNELVTYVVIPLFGSWPDVLIWGQRFFTVLNTSPPVYKEAFAWFVQPEMAEHP